MTMQRETATYDPDLPHDFLLVDGDGDGNDCALCERPRKDELHQVQLGRQRAEAQELKRELGT